MKKVLLLLISVFMFAGISYGQPPLAGTYYIPGGGTPAYPTIQQAVIDLNTLGISDSVTFLVASGHTESYAEPIILTATGSATKSIVFKKNGSGSNPSITRNDAGTISTGVVDGQGDAVIIIQGSDFVTFDGIDVKTLNQGIEYGYYLRKVDGTDACKNVTIKNSVVTMTKGTSAYVCGIFSSNNNDWATFYDVTVTSTGGRTENLSITGNTVQNTHSGIRIIGYNHTTAPYDFFDQNNMVGKSGDGNTIINYGGANSVQKSFGIYLSYQTSANISFNNIDNVAGGGAAALKELSGIYISGLNGGGDFVINNNTITLSQSKSDRIYWIYTAQKCSSIQVNNNTFRVGTTFKSTAASYFMYLSSATPDVTVTGNHNDPFLNIKDAAGDIYGYYYAPGIEPVGGTATIANNVFSGIKMPAAAFWGIFHSGSTTQTVFIENNQIIGLVNQGGTSTTYPISTGISQGKGAAGSTINGNVIENWSGGSHFIGIKAGNPASSGVSVFDNTVRNLTTLRTNTGGNELYIYGILSELGNPCNIYKNKVYNLEANKLNALVYGIIVGNSATTDVHNIYNNFVSDLRTPITGLFYQNPPPLIGIYIKFGTFVNVFNNTVFLNATSTSTGWDFGSAALYAAGIEGTTQDFRNNVLVNLSVPNGWGKTVAYQRNNNLLTMYSLNSDANCLYAGPIEDNTHAVFYDQTAVYNMDAFKTRVAPRETKSFRELPPFEEVSLPPYNLHLKSEIATKCESGGVIITSPFAVINDIDLQPRYPNSGYPNNPLFPASAPDVGADEFAGVPASKTLNLTVFLQGLYAGSGKMNQAKDESGPKWPGKVADHITVELHNSIKYDSVNISIPIPYVITDIELDTLGAAIVTVPGTVNDSYYVTIKHRNSIETTSAMPVAFSGSTINYAFDLQSKAYGDNLGLFIDSQAAVYTGDVNQDGIIDGTDLSDVGNLSDIAASGYLAEDLNGDGLVDGSDLSITGNNADMAISAILP